ncbi:hypothetical protein BDW75DRAFT_74537 [Aspergillus navahoensis]
MAIAIAGSGDLTRYIVRELLRANHQVVLLTRAQKPHFNLAGVTQEIVDFASTPSILSALNSSKATTLISTILTYDTTSFINIHRNLIAAAQQSTHIKRFIPSEYGVNVEDYPDQPAFYWETREPIRKLLRGQSELEWTVLCCGWLADYILPAQRRYLKDIGDSFPVNLADGRMVIPGTGREAVDFTAAGDLARGIAALVNAPSGTWERYIYLSGEQTTLQNLGEQVRKKYPDVKFDVQHLSLRELVNVVRDTKDEGESVVV